MTVDLPSTYSSPTAHPTVTVTSYTVTAPSFATLDCVTVDEGTVTVDEVTVDEGTVTVTVNEVTVTVGWTVGGR